MFDVIFIGAAIPLVLAFSTAVRVQYWRFIRFPQKFCYSRIERGCARNVVPTVSFNELCPGASWRSLRVPLVLCPAYRCAVAPFPGPVPNLRIKPFFPNRSMGIQQDGRSSTQVFPLTPSLQTSLMVVFDLVLLAHGYRCTFWDMSTYHVY